MKDCWAENKKGEEQTLRMEVFRNRWPDTVVAAGPVHEGDSTNEKAVQQ